MRPPFRDLACLGFRSVSFVPGVISRETSKCQGAIAAPGLRGRALRASGPKACDSRPARYLRTARLRCNPPADNRELQPSILGTTQSPLGLLRTKRIGSSRAMSKPARTVRSRLGQGPSQNAWLTPLHRPEASLPRLWHDAISTASPRGGPSTKCLSSARVWLTPYEPASRSGRRHPGGDVHAAALRIITPRSRYLSSPER